MGILWQRRRCQMRILTLIMTIMFLFCSYAPAVVATDPSGWTIAHEEFPSGETTPPTPPVNSEGDSLLPPVTRSDSGIPSPIISPIATSGDATDRIVRSTTRPTVQQAPLIPAERPDRSFAETNPTPRSGVAADRPVVRSSPTIEQRKPPSAVNSGSARTTNRSGGSKR